MVSVAPMSQLQEARGPDDDWTGLRDRAERRKRQNRLNVRAHRRRKAAGWHNPPGSSAGIVPLASTGQTDTCRKAGQQPDSTSMIITTSGAASAIPLPIAHDLDGHRATPAFSLPLSRDHLIPIIELNVYRASLTNIYILGAYSLLCNTGCGYAVNNSEPPLFPWAGHRPSGNIPGSLQPTALQRSTPHEVWIDILPSARMRDNAIVAVAEGRLRNEDLCADILRGICGEGKGCGEAVGSVGGPRSGGGGGGGGGGDDGDEARLIVWKDPWDPSGWEVTEGFLRKWGFLLRGDGEDDMVRATNRWRALRGEDPIVWEVE